ncbi:MAG TPA: hypothetical protein VH950_04415 [Gaiellaceae bacterium]|jgi:hypothetical protein
MQHSPVPSLDELRALARLQGVDPTDEDLVAVTGFLATILPALAGLEARLGPDAAPALFLPEPDGE